MCGAMNVPTTRFVPLFHSKIKMTTVEHTFSVLTAVRTVRTINTMMNWA